MIIDIIVLLIVAINGCAMPWAINQVLELDSEIKGVVVGRYSLLSADDLRERQKLTRVHYIFSSMLLKTIVVFFALIGVPLWTATWQRTRLHLQ